jgi:hypothetical protein
LSDSDVTRAEVFNDAWVGDQAHIAHGADAASAAVGTRWIAAAAGGGGVVTAAGQVG